MTPPATIEQLLPAAAAKLQARQPAEAEKICRQALQLSPNHPDVLRLMAMVYASTGRTNESIEMLRRAIAAAPTRPDFYGNLGMILMQAGRIEPSIGAFRQALQLRPDHAPTHNNLGAVLAAAGRLNQAIEEFQKAVRLNRADFMAMINLGNAYLGKGSYAEAVDAYTNSIAIQPDRADTHNQLGAALLNLDSDEEAAGEFRRALELNPNDAEAQNFLGLYHRKRFCLDEAAACFDRALAARSKYPHAMNNLGITLEMKGQLDQAMACFNKAIELNPGFDAAIGTRAVALHLKPDDDPAALLREHRAWNERYCEPLRKLSRPHANERDPDRQLRIGYFLPRLAAVPTFFSHHDSSKFDPRIYSDANVAGLSNEEASDLIRQDAIDVLIDMAMFLPGGRPPMLARKPAPVQITGMGYPGTMGLWAMDYRLTDPYVDPPGSNDENYSEQSIRLPETLFYYDAPSEDVAVDKTCGITFACLNGFEKVNDITLSAWKQIMEGVSDSRLILLAGEGDHREKAIAKLGVDASRVEFVEPTSRQDFLKLHQRITIRLDTFPCNGRTNCMDSWWMGVPVVSLCGRTAVSRIGLSIASNLGLAEFVAHHADDYVRLARELAADAARIDDLRGSLRERMTQSPLMNPASFARNLEAAYRTAWKQWCEKK